jgi:hypothetical protein
LPAIVGHRDDLPTGRKVSRSNRHTWKDALGFVGDHTGQRGILGGRGSSNRPDGKEGQRRHTHERE